MFRFKILMTLFFLPVALAAGYFFNLNKNIKDQKPEIKTDDLSIRASIPYWVQTDAVKSLNENYKQISSLSLFWYFIDNDGKLAKYADATEDKKIIEFAHEKGIKVSAVITNLPEDENTSWDSDLVERNISTKEDRDKHIGEIIKIGKSLPFDGITIDYEEVDENFREEYTDFISELAQSLYREKLFLGVALHPKSGENKISENNGSRSQDWTALAKAADELYIMGYGEHWQQSRAGPIASIGWLEEILMYADSLNLPLNKFYLGLPMYGLDWNRDDDQSAEGLSYRDIYELLSSKSIQEDWDNLVASPYFEYTDDEEEEHVVWYENARSIRSKMTLARKFGFKGVNFWHLGGEDPAIWNDIKSKNYRLE
ncbi:MAG: peptidoglycan hydrolase [Candidatus Gottesmanbacteria bacterium GW2011_GWA2_43_14]|uniref:Peptidoglycan hydrolase n=1 Tax=Candidatus Gottesmanbacteria bacterium GW2011_GWA2_43_14 TaxID=1618443 RepID=A0A0G1GGE0_9BACT|nr:MAG: peptidoglycan hydrolase [Candidatus Gottesmanbacteria bacterium GW2011_GWA2_43_14]